MILRHLARAAAADQVAPRIAHMRHHRLVVAQRARHQRGRHVLSAILGSQPAVVHRRIGVRNKARHQPDQHGVILRLFEFLGDHRDGGSRCYFAQVHSSHAIGHREQKPVGTHLVPRGRDE